MNGSAKGDFYDEPTRILSNDHLRLEYLTDGGPRIVRLSLAGSDQNLFAEVPQAENPTEYGTYRFRGGHRLWHAPEEIPRSYVPDVDRLNIEDIEGGVRMTQPVEKPTGIVKSIELRLHADRPAVTVTHRLRNEGVWPVTLAPWALTQLPLGGLAVLPQTVGKLDASGMLPNRQLTLWSYASWRDSRLQLFDDYVLIDAQPKMPPIKIGYMNRHGWIGYLRGGVFFCKRFEPMPSLPHVDFGCNVESYCSDLFIEAETVAPLYCLGTGEAATHVEEWELYSGIAEPQTIEGIRAMVGRLGL